MANTRKKLQQNTRETNELYRKVLPAPPQPPLRRTRFTSKEKDASETRIVDFLKKRNDLIERINRQPTNQEIAKVYHENIESLRKIIARNIKEYNCMGGNPQQAQHFEKCLAASQEKYKEVCVKVLQAISVPQEEPSFLGALGPRR